MSRHEQDVWLSERMDTDEVLIGGYDPQGMATDDECPVGWVQEILTTEPELTIDSLFAAPTSGENHAGDNVKH